MSDSGIDTESDEDYRKRILLAPEAFTTCGSIAAYEYHIGMHLAMEHYRHKTQHWQFRLAVILSAVIFLVVLPVIFFLRMSE
ncbi:Baseplate J-like protein [Actinobacillus porcinus]|uniref:Baseplate J-like protein n=1 Tax=Actinobacillus porcinus TaxID=51048 RepID=A0ABY6TL56_9PAST|nr:Baseplate J-like protein [Actinobacillus porcinus]VTU07308.1 Baseplate J-like protein [Actinobacillus porcinus]